MAETARAKLDDKDGELAETDPLFQLTQIMGLKGKPAADAVSAMAQELDSGNDEPAMHDEQAVDGGEEAVVDYEGDADHELSHIFDDLDFADDVQEAVNHDELQADPDDQQTARTLDEPEPAGVLDDIFAPVDDLKQAGSHDPLRGLLADDLAERADDDGGAVAAQQRSDDPVADIDFEDDDDFTAAFAEIDDNFDADDAQDQGWQGAAPLDDIFPATEPDERPQEETASKVGLSSELGEEIHATSSAEPQSAEPESAPAQEETVERIEDRIASIFGRATPRPVPREKAEPAEKPAAQEREEPAEADDPVLADMIKHQPSSGASHDDGADDDANETMLEGDDRDDEAESDIGAVLAASATVAGTTSAIAAKAGEAPELEIVDIDEAVPDHEDDLDIPDISFDDGPAIRTFDDDELDADLTRDFVEPDDDPALETAAAAASTEPEAAIDDFADLFDDTEELRALERSIDEVAVAAAESELAATVLAGNGSSNDFNQNLGDRPFDDAPLADRWSDNGEFAGQSPRPVERRGMLVAAVIGGMALLGGIAAFAMSYGGSGETGKEPVVIKADSEPVKVKPKDPGGKTVPNQDSKVYERVASGGQEVNPAQEKLVTTAEEPVKIASRPLAKSEERLAPGVEVTKLPETDDPVALAPRRVRTMVVRPDGSLVPRPAKVEPEAPKTPDLQAAKPEPMKLATPEAQPDPVNVAKAEPAVTTEPVAPASEPAVTTPVPAAPVETAKPAAPAPVVEPVKVKTKTITKSAANPVVTTPAAVPVVPSRPSDQPVTVIGSTRQDPAPAAAPETAAPVQTAAAATSSRYSMQIASQPSRDAAQATYVALAKRYGSILGGRGMNIVEAEIAGRGTYYRVRIPASSRKDAINLCSRYKSAGGECFVP